MAVGRRNMSNPGPGKRRPALTPQDRETKLVSLAENLAEQQMRDGTASAQVITHYLKLASSRERLEQERLAAEIELQKAKIEAIASHQRTEELYAEAIKAMRMYGGQSTGEVEDES